MGKKKRKKSKPDVEASKKGKNKKNKHSPEGETGDDTHRAASSRLLRKGGSAEQATEVPCTCYHAITHHYPVVNPIYDH